MLADLNLLNAQACHEWVETIVDKGDVCAILRDLRGGQRRISFYEICPELEAEANAYAVH